MQAESNDLGPPYLHVLLVLLEALIENPKTPEQHKTVMKQYWEIVVVKEPPSIALDGHPARTR